MNYKLFVSFLLTIVSLAINGQQIKQSSNLYRSGDMLGKRQVLVDVFALTGKNCVWSLEDAEISNKLYNTEYSTKTDTLIMLERGNRTYYHHENGLVSIIGSENALELISYDMPETWLKYPMQLGDSISGYFNGTGKYCDHLFMRRFGTYHTNADAVGTLVLPEGDILRNVIRLHTERYVGTTVAPIDTIKKNLPVFTVDSIVTYLNPDTAKIREDIYRWYAEGYRYPVLEATTLSFGNTSLSQEIYYFPPEMQKQLGLDEENKQIRKQMEEQQDAWIQGDNGSKTPFSPISISDVVVHGQMATATFDLVEDADVKGLVCTLSGMVLRQQSKHFVAGANRQLNMNCNSLGKGKYVLYLNAHGHVTSEIFIMH